MLTKVLTELYIRDLDKLAGEIKQYENEVDIWKSDVEIANSAGNLCLHLTGNLRHFIGAVLGQSGYVRDRDAEFADRSVPRAEMLSAIEDTKSIIESTLARLSPDALAANYPIDVFGNEMTTGFFLVHLTTHFNYHLGQINYHRRLLGSRH